jgi:O-antigen ligase
MADIRQKLINQNRPTPNILRWGLVSISLLFYTATTDPFNSVKLVLLMALASVALGILVCEYALKKPAFKGTEFYLIAISILFLVTLFVSALISDNRFNAFIGATQRRNGFLCYLALMIIFLLGSRLYNFLNIDKLLSSFLIIGFISSSYGLLQLTGQDFVNWVNPYNNIIGTLGNPNFASSAMAITFIICFLTIFLTRTSLYKKIINFLVLIMSFVAIINSGSRQGVIVIAVGLMFFGFALAYLRFKKLRGLIGVTSTALLLMAMFGLFQIGPLAPYLYKGSIGVRMFYWEAAIQMFKSNPLFGIGVESYGDFFPLFKDAQYPVNYGYELFSNNAHNTFLHFLATCGVFVALLYIIITISVFLIGLKALGRTTGDQQRILLSLISAWVGFQSQSLISIDNIGLSIMNWSLAGAIVALSLNSPSNVQFNTASYGKKSITIHKHEIIYSLVFLLPSTVFSYQFLSAELKTYSIVQSVNANQITDLNSQKTKIISVLNNSFADPNYKLDLVVALFRLGFENDGMSKLNEILIQNPRNLAALQTMIEVKTLQNKPEDILVYRLKIAELDPLNAPNYLFITDILVGMGQFDKAKVYINKVIDLYPNSKEAQLAKLKLKEFDAK